MSRRTLVGALVWLAAVAIVAGVSWVAIDSAGRQVTSADSGVLPGAGPSGTARASATATGSASPSATYKGRPATRTTDAGSVSVLCRDGLVVRWWAQPVRGWQVKEKSSSRDEVEVEFTGSGGSEVKVKGRCVGEVATFVVEEEDS